MPIDLFAGPTKEELALRKILRERERFKDRIDTLTAELRIARCLQRDYEKFFHEFGFVLGDIRKTLNKTKGLTNERRVGIEITCQELGAQMVRLKAGMRSND